MISKIVLLLQIEALYQHAIMLQSKAVEEVRQDEGLLIPTDIDYSSYVCYCTIYLKKLYY